jgi:hypothetical protein
MANLHDLLEENIKVPDIAQLKVELVNKILGKAEVLMRLREGDNVLQVDGFNFYRSTEKWAKLRDIIQILFKKYR